MSLKRAVCSQKSEEEVVSFVIQLLTKAGIQYGDLRLGRDLTLEIPVRNANILSRSSSESCGIGIRVLDRGFWGFCATSH